MTGKWVEIERTWHDTALTNCALCGRLVPRRIWLVEIAASLFRSAMRSARDCTARTGCRSTGLAPARSQEKPCWSSSRPSLLEWQTKLCGWSGLVRGDSQWSCGSRAVYWGNLTWDELRAAATRKPVVIQPIGATEQHGYHLPLNTDNFIVTRLCDAAGRRAPDEMLVLPVIPFAFNAHHMDFPGVVAIKWDHVINYLIDVVESVTTGFDRFIFISGHGVNPPYLAVAGNEVNVRTGALCASLLWTALADNVSKSANRPRRNGPRLRAGDRGDTVPRPRARAQ